MAFMLSRYALSMMPGVRSFSMKKRVRVAVVVVFVITAVLLHQYIAVALITAGHAISFGGLTTGSRCSHVQRLMLCGSPGKRAAIHYTLSFWRRRPNGYAAPYGMFMLRDVKLAFVGYSEKKVASLIGEPTYVTNKSDSVREIIYSTNVEQLGEDNKVQSHLSFVIASGRVADMVLSSDAWRLNDAGEWVRQECSNHTSDGIRQPVDGSPKPSM